MNFYKVNYSIFDICVLPWRLPASPCWHGTNIYVALNIHRSILVFLVSYLSILAFFTLIPRNTERLLPCKIRTYVATVFFWLKCKLRKKDLVLFAFILQRCLPQWKPSVFSLLLKQTVNMWLGMKDSEKKLRSGIAFFSGDTKTAVLIFVARRGLSVERVQTNCIPLRYIAF